MKHEIIHTIFERGGENTAFAQYFVGQSMDEREIVADILKKRKIDR